MQNQEPVMEELEDILIKQAEAIHASDTFGVFVEMGCGVAVINALMEVAGATKTIYAAESPYSKEYQHENYHNAEFRAVSKESVDAVLEGWRDKVNESKINTIYVASFQLGGAPGGSTHGWIGLLHKGVKKFYHVSIHKKMARTDYLSMIANIGMNIILSKNESIPTDSCIDIVEGASHLEMFDMLANSSDEQFLCIRDGEFVRPEDLFRDQNNIILYKGSFNPPHIAHEEIAKIAENKYGQKPVMMISQEIYQKGIVPSTDMAQRVQSINQMGYDVVVSKGGFFNKNIKYLRQKFEQPIIFIVGSDTLNRIFESTYPIIQQPEDVRTILFWFHKDFDRASFMVVERPGFPVNELVTNNIPGYYELVPETYDVSSTKIREMLINNKEEAKKLIPTKIQKNFDKQ